MSAWDGHCQVYRIQVGISVRERTFAALPLRNSAGLQGNLSGSSLCMYENEQLFQDRTN